jgi:putative ABC transport system permease protein
MFDLAFENIRKRSARTFLSVAGFALGVATIFVLISISQGIRNTVKSSVQDMQGIEVTERGSPSYLLSNINPDRLLDILRIPLVKNAAPEVLGLATSVEGQPMAMIPQSFSQFVNIVGVDTSKANIMTSGYGGRVTRGRRLLPGDKNVVNIGKKIAEDYTKDIGQKIEINKEEFRIVGIFTTSSDFYDYMILMDINDARSLLQKDPNHITQIFVEPSDPTKVDQLVQDIEFRFSELEARTSGENAENLGGMFSQVDIFIVVISLVAVLIGTVGVANTMIMSVLERTKELGILRATGWSVGEVMTMVIEESFLIGILGSLVGIVTGLLGVEAVRALAGVTPFISLELIAGSFALGIFFGTFGGVYPALKASHIDPIEALRFG